MTGPEPSEPTSTTIWSGFYKKALKERQNLLRLAYPQLFPSDQPDDIQEKFPIDGLDEFIADNMVENCVGTMGLPVGLGLNFVINNKDYVIPMAVEEPSVIAAASNAAKTVSSFSEEGGFIASHSEINVMIAQIQVLDVLNIEEAIKKIDELKGELIELGNQYCVTMKNRGGGVIDVRSRRITPRSDINPFIKVGSTEQFQTKRQDYLVIHVLVNVCEAMGANIVNTIAEGMSGRISEICNARIGLKILSNLSTERMAKSSFRIPVEKLKYKDFSGEEVANRIIEAYLFAEDDPYRATTSNKGIMNGIDAVAIATGQDWRAIEAAAHGYVSVSNGRYCSMSKYWIEAAQNGSKYLCGKLELPMPVGTKGGVLMTNPVYAYTFGLLGRPNAQTLAMVIVTVGLAQNFGALRALATEGIQRGHMSLHARNIAISAGAPPHAIPEVTSYLVSTKRISVEAAQIYLKAHELHTNIVRKQESSLSLTAVQPSIFYYEEKSNGGMMLNIVFKTLGDKPVVLELTERTPTTDLQKRLLGDKGNSWLTSIIKELEAIKISPLPHTRSNQETQKKLKLLSVLMNIVARRLLLYYPVETAEFVEKILNLTYFKKRRGSGSLSTWEADFQLRIDQESSIPESGLFKTNILDTIKFPSHRKANGISSPSSSSDSYLTPSGSGSSGMKSASKRNLPGNEEDEMVMRVGFPLLMALWQVFEVEVAQHLGQQEIAIAILEDQCQILHSLVFPYPEPSEPTLNFPEFMSNQMKKFQITLFLLCDAIGFESNVITSQFIRASLLLGSYLEWEGIVAHDVIHAKRDESNDSPNAFVYWKHLKKAEKGSQSNGNLIRIQDEKGEEMLKKEFLRANRKTKEIEKVFREQPELSQYFDLQLVLNSSKAILEYYSLGGLI